MKLRIHRTKDNSHVTDPEITALLAATYAARMDDPKSFHATVLKAVDAELSYAEIAEAIGIPRARVFDLVARARQLQR